MSHDSRPVGCFERIKAKFRREKSSPTLPTDPQPSASTHPNDADAATAPHASDASDRAASPYSLRERLWNNAYDQARKGDPETVDGYERILSAQLSQEDVDFLNPPHTNSTDNTTPTNSIAQDVEKCKEQMRRLVGKGAQKIKEEANMKQGIKIGIDVAMVFKEVVDKAVRASHEAALVWVGVCIGVQILMNPIDEAISNWQGLPYVVSRMDWYWELSSLVLKDNIEPDQRGLRGELEQKVTQLYAQLLLYQMTSVCSYYRRRFSVFVRDLVKLDNWEGKVDDITAAEADVQKDINLYIEVRIQEHLRNIAKEAESQNAQLKSISSAIQKQTKQQKEIHETDEEKKCLKALCGTDPRHDKTRIEESKGGLLRDSYRWVLENSDFKRWRDDPQSRLLWVKADPGKGKTMLLCGIIDELQKTNTAHYPVYFFCQATDSRINSATAVLRGLLYMLVDQQRSLISHVREEYDRKGEKLFIDGNAWVAMKEIFTKILNDTKLGETYLIIDALDECTTDLDALLGFIAQNSSVSSRVKWIISSRNWPNIEERLQQAGHKVKLSLELNAESVSKAVSTFISYKVSEMKYDEETRNRVRKSLMVKAEDTFLWVALVCRELENVSVWNVAERLEYFPSGLDALYTRMMQQISNSEDAKVCKQILASMALVYRPITIDELTSLVSRLQVIAKYQGALQKILSSCGSFLTLREETVYFVHQSAKDFLLRRSSEETYRGAFDEIFPSGMSHIHYDIFRASLQTMSETLQRDMYNLKELGYPANNVDKPNPDPLAVSRYACSYWVDHLTDSHHNTSQDRTVALRHGGPVDTFLQQKYLYWLESLSLCKAMSKGVDSMAKLEMLVQKTPNAVELSHLVKDARRFIMYHKGAIEHSPLQAYASALLFSPAGSRVRSCFNGEEPKWIKVKPPVSDAWSACLQTLEGHSSFVQSVAFSHDSTRLASASDDNTVKIWDAGSGACLQTLEGHSSFVQSVAFSHDSTRLASASDDRTVKIWDAGSGACLQTLEGHSDWVRSVAFSHDSTRLASGSDDNTVKIWDADSSACLQTLEGHSSYVQSVAFSHDSTRLASASLDNTVKIWDASSGACLQTLEIGRSLERISFDTTGSYLYTEIGAITITTPPLSQTADNTKPQYQGAGISKDGAWITYKGEHVLWLPSEYRPSCSIVAENSVGIGVGSGKVWICSFLS